jgi:hypothetical protein
MKKLMIRLGKMSKKAVTNTKKIAPTVKYQLKSNIAYFKAGYRSVKN